MLTLTAANSQYAIAIPGVYNAPQLLKGYAADNAFSTEAVENAEVVMGIDGHMSAGFVFNPIKQTVELQSDSPSIDVFNNWALAMKAAREVIACTASIYIPSIGKKYLLTNGYLTNWRPIPDVKKLVQPIQFQITWNDIVGANA